MRAVVVLMDANLGFDEVRAKPAGRDLQPQAHAGGPRGFFQSYHERQVTSAFVSNARIRVARDRATTGQYGGRRSSRFRIPQLLSAIEQAAVACPRHGWRGAAASVFPATLRISHRWVDLEDFSGRRLLRDNDTWASHPENYMTTYENRLIASSHRRIFFCDPRNLVGRRLRGIYQHNVGVVSRFSAVGVPATRESARD
jgi:hypothetical protein